MMSRTHADGLLAPRSSSTKTSTLRIGSRMLISVDSIAGRALPCRNRKPRPRCRVCHRFAAPTSIPFLCTANNFQVPYVGAGLQSGESSAKHTRACPQRQAADIGKTVEGFTETEIVMPACAEMRRASCRHFLRTISSALLAFSHRHSNDSWVRPHDGIPLRTFVHARRNARHLPLPHSP